LSKYSPLLEVIKQASADTMNAAKPFALTYGTVTGTAPLAIRIDQKLELGPAQLLLTSAVRDHSVEMTVSHWTEDETSHAHEVSGGGVAQPTSHRHEYKGRKAFTMHLGLKMGEEVLLLRVQGGQKYIVLDRLNRIESNG